MTLVKFNSRPPEKSFNNLMDDFFYGMPSIITNEALSQRLKSRVPVNIQKSENGFVLEVVAPGFEKENFTVHLEKNALTISAGYKEEEHKTGQYSRREYRLQPFKRSFMLDESIDAEKIDAKYINGILVVNLPKKADVKEPVKQIAIN